MKRLLLISYYFPPLGGSGVFRALRLAKYLPRRGWGVTVLTVNPRVRLPKDPALLADVPAGVSVEPTATIEPRTALLLLNRLRLRRLARWVERWWMAPDDQIGWAPFAVRRGRRLLNVQPYDVILSTAGPYSAHLVARALKRRSGAPWVADFRDEWTTNPYLTDRYPTTWHRRLNQRLERAVLAEADRVVCVSGPWLDNLRARAPEAPATKFRVLTNGYDGEHFARAAGPPPDRFRVVYTGAFYGHRNPAPFLDAVRLVLRERLIPAADLEVVFIGQTGQATGLGDLPAGVLRVLEQRPHFEATAHLRQAAVLLLVVPRAGGAGNHTGKLFHYLAAGRPILALAPEANVAADLIRRTSSGVVAPPDDPRAIAGALAELHGRWRAGVELPDQDRAAIASFDAARQVDEWLRLFAELSP